MSRRDMERRQDNREALLGKAKEHLRLAQELLTDWYEGVDCAASARRRSVSRTTVWRVRVWLGVQNRRVEPGGKSAGRLGNRQEIEGVTL